MFVLIWIFTPTVFMADDPRTLWSGARKDRRKSCASDTASATVDYFRLVASASHRAGVFVVGLGDQRSFSGCAGESQQLGVQQLGVRYGREYVRTTGRRDGLGAGG